MEIKYFDNAATTRIKEEVFREMVPYLTNQYGNASSIYKIGRDSRRAIEQARGRVASLFNSDPSEIYFTSCGSESDNMALKGMAYLQKEKGTGKDHIITSKIEHPAILESCKTLEKQGFRVTYLDVDKEGVVDLNSLENAIDEKTFLISIMYANNEIGTIEPIEQISKIAHNHNIIFHTDAVQATGNVDIDVKKLNIDILSMSGHKIYAPKGIGAIYIRKGIEINRFMDGGHQEKNKRAGTENVAGIVGIGKAIELAYKDFDNKINYLKELRDYYIKKVEENISDIKINGDMNNRLAGNINISFKEVDGGELLLKLDEKGICVSTGSACNSESQGASHVLTAIGLEPCYANGSVRVSLGKDNNKEEIDYFVDVLKECISELRKNKSI